MTLILLASLGLLLALVLIGIGVRGRVVQRGRFCRRCRFDLAGIEPDDPGARCTECGRSVISPAARRSTLRARRRWPIIAGTIILLLYAGVGAIVLSGSAPAVLARMPSGIVLASAQWGSDAALDELVLRLGRTPTLTDAYWARAIEHALAFQADRSKAWDPRWGEVLAMAWVGDRLDPEQARAYISNGQQAQVRIRDRLHPATKAVGVSSTFSFDRMTAINPVQTGLRLDRSISTMRINGIEVRKSGAMSRSQLIIPDRSSGGSTGMGNTVPIPDAVRATLAPGQRAEVFVEFTFALKAEAGEVITIPDPVRYTQTVIILDPDEPIVRVVDDPDAAARLIAGCEIEPIVSIRTEGRSEYGRNSYGDFSIYFNAPPKAVAGTLSLRTKSGEELGITPFSLAPSSGTHGVGGMTIHANENQPQRLRLIERIIADGRVDVIFRTDPAQAENNPNINEVVELEMIFRDVPVLSVESRDELYSAKSSHPRVPAEEFTTD